MEPDTYKVKSGCIFRGQLRQYTAGETLSKDELSYNVQCQMEKLEVASTSAPKPAKPTEK
jgi:hypothetical protein